MNRYNALFYYIYKTFIVSKISPVKKKEKKRNSSLVKSYLSSHFFFCLALYSFMIRNQEKFLRKDCLELH